MKKATITVLIAALLLFAAPASGSADGTGWDWGAVLTAA